MSLEHHVNIGTAYTGLRRWPRRRNGPLPPPRRSVTRNYSSPQFRLHKNGDRAMFLVSLAPNFAVVSLLVHSTVQTSASKGDIPVESENLTNDPQW